MNTKANSEDALVMNRREALKRTGLLFGTTALSASTMTGALYAQSKAAPAGSALTHFTTIETATIEAVVDRILPRTDTPGALDVGVPQYIDVLYGEYLTPDEKKTLKHGIEQTNGQSREAHGKAFADLKGAHQDGILREMVDANPKNLRQFRQLALSGYFTSEEVMKNVLNYDFIPGMWKGCVDLSEVGNRVWAH